MMRLMMKIILRKLKTKNNLIYCLQKKPNFTFLKISFSEIKKKHENLQACVTFLIKRQVENLQTTT